MAPLSDETEQLAPGEEVLQEEEEEESEERPTRQKKRRKKMLMGEESGLTDDQRRELRRSQRNIAKQLQEGPIDEDEDFVDKVRKKNNELFEDVRYTREAVLDAENVDAIAAKFVQKADTMITAPRFDANKFVSKIKQKLTARADGVSYFDWQLLGNEAGVCFNAIPSRVTFLSGPLENGKVPEKRKVRAVRQKREKVEEEELEEQKPEQLEKKKKNNTDRLSQAEKDLKILRNVLDKRTDEAYAERKAKYDEIKKKDPEAEKEARKELQEHGHDVDFVPLLVNPKSFTQTVENIFNFSFLIKKGEAGIRMRKPQPLGDSQGSGSSSSLGLPESGCFVNRGRPDNEGPTKQCVLSFSMRDWRNLIEAYDLEECDIPTRKTKQTAYNSQQQSSSQQEDEEVEE